MGRIEVIDRLLLRTSEVPWVVFSGGASSPLFQALESRGRLLDAALGGISPNWPRPRGGGRDATRGRRRLCTGKHLIGIYCPGVALSWR